MAAALRFFSPSFGYQLFLLSLLHVGCLCFSHAPASNQQRQPPPPRRRKISPFSQPEPSPSAASRSQHPSSDPPKPKPGAHHNNKPLSFSIRPYLRWLFLFSGSNTPQQSSQQQTPPTAGANPASPDQAERRQLRHCLASPDGSSATSPKAILKSCASPSKPIRAAETCSAGAGAVKRPSFASRADIHPCASCGEVFEASHLLDLHRAARHAFSELPDGDSGKNIVRIIFQSGWKGHGGGGGAMAGPTVHRILRIHHSPRALARFEEHRDAVRSRAADERCAVDGNERLRFYCATVLCGLGREGTCDSPFCAACGIVRHGFSGKDTDGIPTHATGWAAHASLPEELEREFAFMRARRAMLVCRVVAGRVRHGKAVAAAGVDGGCEYEYDSVMASAAAGGGDGAGAWTGEGELVVFHAWAVLPCFVIVYSV